VSGTPAVVAEPPAGVRRSAYAACPGAQPDGSVSASLPDRRIDEAGTVVQERSGAAEALQRRGSPGLVAVRVGHKLCR
jgi:hypothetical protein